MTSVYDQLDKATPRVSAYFVTTKEGDPVGKIVFTYPKDGMGRQFCYLHIIGTTMVRGYASGCGYDKHSASASSAARHLELSKNPDPNELDHITAWKAALEPDNGWGWQRLLEAQGYRVHQVV